MASLAQKDVTQATIVRKLSSYVRQNQTRRALWELDNLLRTIYKQIWNECSRLMTNAVIFYNTALLSKVYEQKQRVGDREAMEIIAGLSPIAWQHVNLFGSFEFTDTDSQVDLNALAERFADAEFWNKALQDASELELA